MNDTLKNQLREFGQEHLLTAWERWDAADRARLEAELAQIDLAQIARLSREGPEKADWADLVRRVQAPPACRLDDPDSRYSPQQARERGAGALAAGQVAAVVVAGGQGTRLGFAHPKGLYRVGPITGTSLFQMHIEKVRAVARRYETTIPLYVMTSPATHDETAAFLQEYDNFGLAAADLKLFCQGTMPAVDAETGRLLLSEPGGLALSPDGHGGMLQAMIADGVMDDIQARGVEQLFYFQIDNPLTPICDAELLGYHLLDGSELTTIAVAKTSPDERVGNIVQVDGRVRIIEYSDLPPEEAERKNASGGLELWAGNTAIHVFDAAFLRRMAASGDALPFHIALKKTPHLDAQDRRIQPETPNSLKFERFIFDLLPAARRALVVETERQKTFVPLKNASGAASDTPEHVREGLISLYAGWLAEAGAVVEPGVAVEISPLFALDAAELAAKIAPGTRIAAPTAWTAKS